MKLMQVLTIANGSNGNKYVCKCRFVCQTWCIYDNSDDDDDEWLEAKKNLIFSTLQRKRKWKSNVMFVYVVEKDI